MTTDEIYPRLEVGSAAPGFCLPDQDDKQVCLTDYRGRRVVLYFYPKDDTPGCTTEACDFNLELAHLLAAGTSVLGISPDSPSSHRAFISKYALGLTLLCDPSMETIKAYGAYGTKQLYGRPVTGVMRSTLIVGRLGEVEAAFYNVRATGHARRVSTWISKHADS